MRPPNHKKKPIISQIGASKERSIPPVDFIDKDTVILLTIRIIQLAIKIFQLQLLAIINPGNAHIVEKHITERKYPTGWHTRIVRFQRNKCVITDVRDFFPKIKETTYLDKTTCFFCLDIQYQAHYI